MSNSSPPNRTCTQCKQSLPREEFSSYVSKSRGLRIRSNCKACELKRFRRYNTTHAKQKREGSARQRQKKIEAGGDIYLRYLFNNRLGSFRRESQRQGLPEVTVDATYLIDLYHHQKGTCHYSGESMLAYHGLGTQQPMSISVDRKVPSLGYIKGNVVLCTQFANTSKGAKTLEEFKEWIGRLHELSAKW